MSEDWVRGIGHSPVCQILLQIVVRAVITSSPPAWTSSAGMLSTPAGFLSSVIVLQPQLLCEGWGGHPLYLSGDSSVLMDLHWPCNCTAQSSIMSSSVSVALLLGIFMNVLGRWSLSPVLQWSSLSPVGMPSYCCSSSDFPQSYYIVLLSIFL